MMNNLQPSAFNRQPSAWLILLILLTTGFLLPTASVTIAAVEPSPESVMQQGQQAYQRGSFAQALQAWKQAADLFKASGNAPAQVEALVHSAQASMGLGRSTQALQFLELALALAQTSGNPLAEASVLGHLGRIYVTLGRLPEASDYLQQASALAKQERASPLLATTANDLGILSALKRQDQEALNAFEDSVVHAQYAKLPLLAATAKIGRASCRERV